jgi:hypothetical protein
MKLEMPAFSEHDAASDPDWHGTLLRVEGCDGSPEIVKFKICHFSPPESRRTQASMAARFLPRRKKRRIWFE